MDISATWIDLPGWVGSGTGTILSNGWIVLRLVFGLPVFTLPIARDGSGNISGYGITLIEEIRDPVLILVWMGAASMVIGFYIVKNVPLRKWPQLRLARGVDPVMLNYLYWLLLTGHFVYRLFPTLKSLPSIGQFLEPAGFVAIAGLYLNWRAGHLPKSQKLIFGWIGIPLFLYVRIKLLFLTDILLFAIFAFFIFWREKQFKTITGLIALSLFILSFYAATTTVRGAYENPIEKIYISAVVYYKLVFMDENLVRTIDRKGIPRTFGSEGRFGALVRRTGHLWVLHRVADLSPDIVPYWRGETYKPLLTSLIPRAIYPDKPIENFGFKFGHRYKILKSLSSHTSLNIPWLTEMLANFGSAGVLVGMAFAGMFLGALERSFNVAGMSNAEFAVGATILFPLTYPESNFSVMTGSLPLVLMTFLICFAIFSRVSRQMAVS